VPGTGPARAAAGPAGTPLPDEPAPVAATPAAKPAQPALPEAAKAAGPLPADATAALPGTDAHIGSHGDKGAATDDKNSTLRTADALQVDTPAPTSANTPAQPAAPAGDQSQAGALQSVGTAATAAATAQAPAAPAMAAAAAAAVPIAGVAVEIAAHARAGSNRFEIRLDPPDLGRIDVRLDVDRQGNVTSHLVVERSATLDMLRRDAPQLERALQDAGLKTSTDGLQFSLRDQGAGAQNQSFQESTARTARVIVPTPEIPPVDTVRSYGRLLGANGGVDIRV
jgi:flagellar hook-length control protein FliK